MLKQVSINQILSDIPSNIVVVCAIKYVDTPYLYTLFDNKITHFGENKVSDFLRKKKEFTLNATWHFIGHLQTNKVRDVINEIDYLHSLDSLKLAETINKYSMNRLNCFVEVNLLKQATKSGISIDYLEEFLKNLINFEKINPIGFMMMSNPNDDEENTFQAFCHLKDLATKYYHMGLLTQALTSMGMSDDYHCAINAKTDFIRLGRILCKGEYYGSI